MHIIFFTKPCPTSFYYHIYQFSDFCRNFLNVCCCCCVVFFQVNEVEMNFGPWAISEKNYEKKKKKSNDCVLTIICSVTFIFRGVPFVCVSRGKKCQFFGKFPERNIRMIPEHCTFIFNPFLTNFLILYPLKAIENLSFFVSSGDIKWKHWLEMG